MQADDARSLHRHHRPVQKPWRWSFLFLRRPSLPWGSRKTINHPAVIVWINLVCWIASSPLSCRPGFPNDAQRYNFAVIARYVRRATRRESFISITKAVDLAWPPARLMHMLCLCLVLWASHNLGRVVTIIAIVGDVVTGIEEESVVLRGWRDNICSFRCPVSNKYPECAVKNDDDEELRRQLHWFRLCCKKRHMFVSRRGRSISILSQALCTRFESNPSTASYSLENKSYKWDLTKL